MGLLLMLSEAADSADIEASSMPEPTLNDAIHGLVEKPETTLNAIGEFFASLWTSFLNAIPSIFLAIIVLIIGLILTKLCVKLMSKGLSKTKLELTVVKFTTQITKIVLYVLLLTIVLSLLGIPSTSVITVIGTAGVAIGLALQNSLSNVAGGFILMLTKPFKIGDYIVTNGVEGFVTHISIMHTRLDSVTNQAIFVPNGLAVNATIINNSGNDTRRVDLSLSISYNNDFYIAQKVIKDIIEAHELVDKTKPIDVRMMGHGESAIIITARSWCNTGDYWTVYFDLTEQIRAAFIENDIEIPYNQLDVHIDNISK
ncbi:MAG: mechanosensitive ion channel family protein [Oscillospiraceae bacterium]|nr:mechanosensitive ion channel family protein [Oscillospiraceae bacterium]